ncbi:MAG: hypothetical protein M1839_006763 [Geoglossum umbratile]|nr:MAG: hypothetical protein M1839_006763 [Geoglossum umbratile]
MDSVPALSSSSPTLGSTEPAVSEDDEALEVKEAGLIRELDRINRKERIGVLHCQIDKRRTGQSILSEEAEETQTLSSQWSATTQTQSETVFDLPLPKQQGQLPLGTKKPPEYQGKSRAEYTDFLGACALNFRASSQTFKTDEEKITFTIQYLKGSPQNNWWCYKAIHGLNSNSWKEFTAILKEALGDPENRIRDFAKRLELLAEDPDDLSKELRFQRLLSGFRKEIQDTISVSPIAPKGCLALIAQASRTKESLGKETLQTESWQSTALRSTSSYPPKSNIREEAWRRTEAEELKEKRREEGGCYECGEIGHNAACYPNRKASITSLQPRPSLYQSDQLGKGNTQ